MNMSLIGLGIALLTIVLLLVFGYRGRKGRWIKLRPIRAYDNFDTMVAQAVESGGRVHISLGNNTLYQDDTAATLASLSIMDDVVETAAISDRAPIITTAQATTQPLASDVMRRAYNRRDRSEQFERERAAVRLAALDDGVALAGAVSSTIHDDNVQANILMGSFGPEVALMAETGHRHGIPQAIGSDQLEGQVIAYAMADHSLVGEELLVAPGYLTPDNASAQSAIAVQDILRWVVIGAIILGALLRTFDLPLPF
ncbi:MAG: hypothetical protein GYB68_02965 [Chloroflexi bacterium]|nr:hypothetical protein [Chloroflexota bacterium]